MNTYHHHIFSCVCTQVFLVTDYVEEVYQTFLWAVREDKLHAAVQELREMTPDPMNTMLTKQPKDEALKKSEDRQRMQVQDVPPTTPGSG